MLWTPDDDDDDNYMFKVIFAFFVIFNTQVNKADDTKKASISAADHLNFFNIGSYVIPVYPASLLLLIILI